MRCENTAIITFTVKFILYLISMTDYYALTRTNAVQWSCLHWSRSFSMRSLISDIGAVLPPVVRLLAPDWSAQSPRRADWLACTGLTWSWKLHGLFSELRRLQQLLALWYSWTRPRNQRRTEQEAEAEAMMQPPPQPGWQQPPRPMGPPRPG